MDFSVHLIAEASLQFCVSIVDHPFLCSRKMKTYLVHIHSECSWFISLNTSPHSTPLHWFPLLCCSKHALFIYCIKPLYIHFQSCSPSANYLHHNFSYWLPTCQLWLAYDAKFPSPTCYIFKQASPCFLSGCPSCLAGAPHKYPWNHLIVVLQILP